MKKDLFIEIGKKAAQQATKMGLIGEKLQDSISKFVFMVIIFFLATATRGLYLILFSGKIV